ncbi:MAG: nucleotidyl transferase AbiEii/AbiGii toxin family protein [Coxiellaceae bacterium]|nr:nucleotidyl transferase AbiEii/AbiGii toxin family protein [Coxiellaceae bacterium]
MTKTNMAESVRARLLNITRNSKQSGFENILLRFMLERTLYRIGQSRYQKQFLLKGAMLFALWYDMPHRQTRDIDLLAFGDNDLLAVKKIFQEIAKIPFDDGIVFDIEHITVERILEETAYIGVKVTIPAELAKAIGKIQIDVGFGDAVTPGPVDSQYPVLIKEFPSPQLQTYPVYTVVAEKLHAIAFHGAANSRVKDYLDLFVIFEREQLDPRLLQKAITATFARRGSVISKTPLIGLTDDFANNPLKQTMWSAFLRKNKLSDKSFPAVVKTLRGKLQPILDVAIV